MYSSYFFRFVSRNTGSISREFPQISKNIYLNRSFQVRSHILSNTVPKSPPSNINSKGENTIPAWVASIGTLLLGVGAIIKLYSDANELKGNLYRIESSLNIKKDVGLLDLKALVDRSDEEAAQFLRGAKKEVLSFARTAHYAFKDRHENVIKKEIESLLGRGVKIKIILPRNNPALLDKLQNTPDLQYKEVEKRISAAVLEIKKLNSKYPHNKIEVRLTNEFLFVTGDLIDYSECNAKVAYTRGGAARHSKPLIFTFSKNLGEGIGFHETADKMIEIWNDLPEYDLENNNEYTQSSSSTFFQNKNESSSIPIEKPKSSSSPELS